MEAQKAPGNRCCTMPPPDSCISELRLVRFVDGLFVERFFLTTSLEGKRGILEGVSKCNTALFMSVAFCVVLLYVGSPALEVLGALVPLLLTWSFVFGSTLQEAFEGFIFIFSMRPYDVGDVVKIMNATWEKFEVKKIEMLHTVFRRIDGGEERMLHRELRQREIINLTLSGSQCDFNTVVYIRASQVDKARIDAIDKELKEYIAKFPNSFKSAMVIPSRLVHPMESIMEGSSGLAKDAQYLELRFIVVFVLPEVRWSENTQAKGELLIFLCESVFPKYGLCQGQPIHSESGDHFVKLI